MNQHVNDNSDAKYRTQTPRPSSREELGRRLSVVLDLFETRQEASSIADRSTDQLWKWTRGAAEPPFRAVSWLCLTAGVRMEWLATGEGPMMAKDLSYAPKPAPPRHSQEVRESDAAMDTGLLSAAVRITEDVLHQFHVRERVDAAGFAELVSVVYQDLAHGKAEDAASAALSRIFAIARAPQD